MESEIRKGMSTDFYQYPYKQITSKDIENQNRKWFMREEIPRTLKDDCYILNLDDKENSGSHWTSFIVSRQYLFYVDSFGNDSLSGYPPKEIEQFARYNKLKLITSPYWFQYPKSWMCGYHSLYICDLFDDYIGRLTPALFHKIMKQQFDPDGPDLRDIQTVSKWSKSKGLM